jgi:predicted DsbA family dithiol-disulfide isomerase
VGLSADRTRAILGTDEYAEEVRAEERFFIENGIQAVPAIIIEQRHLISGGQPVEVFENALRQIAAAKRG